VADAIQIPRRPSFGSFEVDLSAGELLKGGIRVRLPGQPFAILLMLLKNPGEVVTREQLRDQIWAEGTFVDFEHGLNASMNKLRKALGDSAEKPRYIETVPGRGYRFIAAVAEARRSATGTEASRKGGPSAEPPEVMTFPLQAPGTWWERKWRLAAVMTAVLAICAGAAWRLFRVPVSSQPVWKLTRLTTDSGLSSNPALSRDGKLIAYSSDREASGHLELYVQQIAGGGHPIRLTFDGMGNTAPDFSPDGNRLVYRSNRDGGGIYEIPAFGGQARLLASDGLDPKYSPDGKEVAYWVGSANIAHAVPGNGAIWVVPIAGGHPRQVATNLTSARLPIWAPDGKHLLVIGYASHAVHDSSALDWWLVPAHEEAGKAVRVGMLEALARTQVQTRDAAGNLARSIPVPTVPKPGCWVAEEGAVVFSTVYGDTQNLWAAHLSADGTMIGEVRELTAGADQELDPSCAANGSIAFADSDRRSHVWGMPFDEVRQSATGVLDRFTSGLAREDYPSISSDGRRAAYGSDESGLRSVWVRDVAKQSQIRVAPSPFAQRFPVLSGSGNRVAFSSYERDKRPAYAVAASGGTPELLCADCLRVTDWSHDERAVLVVDGSPYRISTIDTSTRKQTVLIQHSSFHVIYGRFSPDNRWVSFTVRRPNNRSWITVAPLEGRPKPIAEGAWTKISEEGPEDRANWSSDGRTLYFTSGRDGWLCLWGQRIDRATGRPVGEAFPAHHFHQGALLQQLGWSLQGGRLAVTLMENTGNLWLMTRPWSH
jgi:Tol biopolymer transport system component/DNA-binding winged helix-turn-helix (wHTH) protein